MKAIKAIFRTIIGGLFGIASALALSPAIAAVRHPDDPSMTPLILAIVLFGLVLGLFASTIRQAFGRGFLILGASVFSLPISVMLLSGRATHDMVSGAAEAGAGAAEQVGTAIGAGIAGIALTGVSAVVGFIFGTVLLIVGLVLVLGGRREVVIRS